MFKPEFVVVHHSLTKDGDVVDTSAIIRYHEEELGWHSRSGHAGGYHDYVEYVGGEIVHFKGREEDEEGAHTKELSMNRRAFGVCVIGNFDLAPPPIAVLKFLVNLIHARMAHWPIPVQNVLGHREVGAMAGYDWRKVGPTGVPEFKSCPGKLFPMDTLRMMVSGAITF